MRQYIETFYLEYAMFKVLESAIPRQDESSTDLWKCQVTFIDIIKKVCL